MKGGMVMLDVRAQWRALCTKITQVIICICLQTVFVKRNLHETVCRQMQIN